MKRKNDEFFLLFILASLALSGCFSPWKGNEATLTLLFGGSPGNRAVIQGVVHTIELDGPTGGQTHKTEGAKPFSVTVMPGYWHISVKASRNDKLYAEGEGGADVKAGRNNQAEIKMSLVTCDMGIFINFPADKDGQLSANVDHFTISQSENQQQFIEVKGDFSDIQWFIWGIPISGEKAITIKAADYNPGTYQLVVMVIDKNGVPYSNEITFEVTE